MEIISTQSWGQWLLVCLFLGADPKGTSEPWTSGIDPIHGVPTVVVNGSPLLVLGAQCDIWRSTRQDDKTVAFFDGFRDMHATAVGIGIPWSRIEAEEGDYQFAFIDWFIRHAQSRDLKLILNLFNTNICGKVNEGSGYPQYTPSWILDKPEQYQRMQLRTDCAYVEGGPPMCPNDPRTLERERRLVVKVAEHLKETDACRTVIMLQINNEFYYQQWSGRRPENPKSVRCHCRWCDQKFNPDRDATGEEFMFRSFAEYLKVLTDAISQVIDLPLYINSPWWDPYIIPIFLQTCPNLDLVGIDGILAPQEPNILTRSQVDRNIPFASENPTENPKTRFNLDILPYYTVVGPMGLGNLLWECHTPHTVVDDAAARRKYAEALYPLKNAMVPIANARGTDRLVGWYAIRDFQPNLATDVFGNFVPADKESGIVSRTRFFIRQGRQTRVTNGARFDVTLGGVSLDIGETTAGIIVSTRPGELLVATSGAEVRIRGAGAVAAEEGVYLRQQWNRGKPLVLHKKQDTWIVEIGRLNTVRLLYDVNQ